MSREDPQMKIRFPPELKAEIEAAAKANSRSMNAEVVVRLLASFEEDAGELKRLISALMKALQEEKT
jgi:hypothetical protein